MCEILGKLIRGDVIDPVTRLPNSDFLEKAKEVVKGDSDDVWLIEVDVTVDKVEKTLKDIVISKIASTIKHSVRIPKDMVVRMGEYEFAVLVSGVDERLVKTIASRIGENVNYLSLTVAGKSLNPKAVVRYSKL